MCQEISFFVTHEKEPRILSHDPWSHAGGEEYFKLKPGKYSEAEWTEGKLVVRGDNKNWYASAVLSRFPTRDALIEHFMRPPETDGWRHYALKHDDSLTDKEVQERALAITEDGYRYCSIRDCERISKENVQAIALAITDDWFRYQSIRDCERISKENVQAIALAITHDWFRYQSIRYCERITKATAKKMRRVHK